LSNEVINKLLEKEINITPNNFSIYFYKILDKKELKEKEEILNIIDLENGLDSNIINIEKHFLNNIILEKFEKIFKTNLNNYKNILSIIKKIQNSKNKKDFLKKQKFDSLLLNFEQDLLKLNNILFKNQKNIKNNIETIYNNIKNIKDINIYHIDFNMYNEKYIKDIIQKELKLFSLDNNKKETSLIFLKLKDINEIEFNTQKQLNKTIAKLLIKTGRRSDVIGYLGDDVFVILLKYTNFENAKKTINRIKNMVENTTLFIKDKEVQLLINIDVIELNDILTYNELIQNGIKSISDKKIDLISLLKDEYFI
jgi:diguanylate cyclase (GGDEF)-like protein